MQKHVHILLAAALFVLLSCELPLACTTFVFKDASGNLVFGKNLDYSAGSAHVTVNKRDVSKTSRIAPPEVATSWTSRYGSVTFDMLGKEFAQGGMNEAGLVIESLLVPQGKYAEKDGRPGLIMQQWVQYHMDNSATVADVIASDAAVRMSFLYPRVVHFLVADKQGNVAVIEFIDGRMKAYTGKDLPFPVLTNSPYEASAAFAGNNPGEAKAPFEGNPFENSLPRFARAAKMVRDWNGSGDPVAYAYSILTDTKLDGDKWGSRWSIVYDIKNMMIHYKTATNQSIRTVDMKAFDYACGSEPLFIDIESPVRGKSDFSVYSTQANRELIEKSFNSIPGLRDIASAERDARAAYPDSARCSANPAQ
ncbi:MAG: linear amide C-N hydrolase [Acidobacteriota bacterium]